MNNKNTKWLESRCVYNLRNERQWDKIIVKASSYIVTITNVDKYRKLLRNVEWWLHVTLITQLSNERIIKLC